MKMTLLDARAQGFVTKMVSTGLSNSSDSSLALARYLAYKLPVSTEQIDNIDNYFRTNHLLGITTLVSDINELMVLDYEEVFDLTRNLYMFRYATAQGCMPAVSPSETDKMGGFLGLHRHLSPKYCSIIVEDPVKLTFTVQEYKHLCERLLSKKVPSSGTVVKAGDAND